MSAKQLKFDLVAMRSKKEVNSDSLVEIVDDAAKEGELLSRSAPAVGDVLTRLF